MRKLLIPLVLLGLLFSLTSIGLANFSDAPQTDHWAYENFKVLYNAGLIKGYPDGIFKGEQQATRYEMIELTGRVLKYMEGKVETALADTPKYLTEEEVKALIADAVDNKEDLDAVYKALQNLENEFKNELAALDLKVTTLAAEVATLKNDVATLQTEVATLKEANLTKDQQIDKAEKDAKTATTLAYIAIALSVLSGIAALLF